MFNATANRGAKRRHASPNTPDYNEFEVPRVPLFSMPLTKSRKIFRFPYGRILSAKSADTPRPTKRVKWNKEPAHWRATEGEFVDGTILHPSSSISDSDDNNSSDSEPSPKGGPPSPSPRPSPGPVGSLGVGGIDPNKLSNTSNASNTSDPDLIMLDGSPCSSKVELDLRQLHHNKRRLRSHSTLSNLGMGPMGPLGFLSEPALYQTIDWAVEKTLKKKLVPHLNKVEQMAVANSEDALEKMRERIRVSYQEDFERLEAQVRKVKREAKEKEREIERLVKEREDGYWSHYDLGQDQGGVREEMALQRVREMFKVFRGKVWEFVCGSALQLETKNKVTEVDVMRLPWVPDKQLFGNASVEVRRYLVMAAVFQVLYSRILRPGHKTFGAELDGEVDEAQETRRVERQLEELEEYLMRNGKVGQKGEAKWRAVNINLFKQLRQGVLTVEAKSAAQTLYGYLEPLMKFTFSRNEMVVEKMIEQLCEQALDLKLAIRKSPVPLRIETASRSTDEDGDDNEDLPDWEPRVDKKTGKPWIDPRWHEKMGQLKLTTEEKEANLARIKYIAFIPFGALARCEPNEPKVVVERAWVIGRA